MTARMRGVARTAWVPAARAAVLGVVALSLVAACGGGKSSDKPRPPPSASPSVTVDPKVTEASSAALAAYTAYQDLNATAQLTADTTKRDEFVKVTGDPLLVDTMHSLVLMDQHGIVINGKPISSPTVANVQLAASPPTADISDCLDSTNATAIYKATGKSAAPPGKATRNRVVLQAELVDGHWYVYKVLSSGSTPC